MFDSLTKESGHIVLVLSPLLTLIDDQIQNLRALGMSCVSLSHLDTDKEISDVEKGFFQVVYATPEAILKKKRWRQMLHNNTYASRTTAQGSVVEGNKGNGMFGQHEQPLVGRETQGSQDKERLREETNAYPVFRKT